MADNFLPFAIWRHRHLIQQLTKREVVDRYRGSIFGLLWSFLHPLLMLLVYLFVFGFVFKMKWGIDTDTEDVSFGVILFSGLILHALLAECLVRSPTVIVGNPQYVKKVVFPLELLPVVVVCTAMFHFFVGLIILLVFQSIAHEEIFWTSLYLPLVLLPFVMLIMGITWLLSSLGVFVRDVSHIVGILATVLLFLCPIFYPLEAVPALYQPWLWLNPLTLIVQQTREIVIFGMPPNWHALGIYFLISATILFIGYYWFQKTRNAFADVL